MHSSSTSYILKDRICAAPVSLVSNVLIHFCLTTFLFLLSHGSHQSTSSSSPSPYSSSSSSPPPSHREPPVAMLHAEHQRYDGWYNNLAHADWGSLGAYSPLSWRDIECICVCMRFSCCVVCLCKRKAFCNKNALVSHLAACAPSTISLSLSHRMTMCFL